MEIYLIVVKLHKLNKTVLIYLKTLSIIIHIAQWFNNFLDIKFFNISTWNWKIILPIAPTPHRVIGHLDFNDSYHER